MSEHTKKKSPWMWLSLFLLLTNLFFVYRYFQIIKNDTQQEGINRIEEPIISDERDIMLESMSSTIKPVKLTTYKPTSNQSLSQIANKFKVSVTDIKKVNPSLKYRLPTYIIRKGTPIKVPVKVSAPSKPPVNPVQGTPSTLTAYQKEVLDLTNKERAKLGLSALKADFKALNDCAYAKSNDMDQNNYFAHQSPKYGSPFDMMKSFGISYTSAAENIAMGQQTPAEVVKAWMNSSGHRANILNGQFTYIGIGYKKGKQTYWTQQFISK
ncbi:CAP domain-containing protein [Gottfriedia acidiceleris]|uniref:CAP domain-containing protein n=1 Tax=Gottfriedia acidiceleris TaxID=371036 RepID=A0ABY4JUP3_9BACI|nr:CAP domain-containing protein [Gottfriedia acidiceleris]UPM56357.1 CAP domain-containing protein [Gottfriedia acidiceleris]